MLLNNSVTTFMEDLDKKVDVYYESPNYLYGRYARWCHEQGLEPVEQEDFEVAIRIQYNVKFGMHHHEFTSNRIFIPA